MLPQDAPAPPNATILIYFASCYADLSAGFGQHQPWMKNFKGIFGESNSDSSWIFCLHYVVLSGAGDRR
jgi:hypothetical protein